MWWTDWGVLNESLFSCSWVLFTFFFGICCCCWPTKLKLFDESGVRFFGLFWFEFSKFVVDEVFSLIVCFFFPLTITKPLLSSSVAGVCELDASELEIVLAWLLSSLKIAASSILDVIASSIEIFSNCNKFWLIKLIFLSKLFNWIYQGLVEANAWPTRAF